MGSGQTGVQIAEELHIDGRGVTLACGRAPWSPRRIGDLDIVTWLARAGFYDQPRSALASPADRLVANLQATGANGGHDLHYRVLQAMGVRLAGHLAGVAGHRAGSPTTLPSRWRSATRGTRTCGRFWWIGSAPRESRYPQMPDPPPFRCAPVHEVDLRGFGAVILTAGFRPDYTRWIHFPVFDDLGVPHCRRRSEYRGAGAVLLRGSFSPDAAILPIVRRRSRRGPARANDRAGRGT